MQSAIRLIQPRMNQNSFGTKERKVWRNQKPCFRPRDQKSTRSLSICGPEEVSNCCILEDLLSYFLKFSNEQTTGACWTNEDL